MKPVRLIFLLGLLAALAGCAVGPNYHAPKVAMPGDWSAPGSGGTTNSVAQLASWWKNFNDPELDSLIDRAVKSNLDLKMAEALVRQARALRGAALADFVPTIDGKASYTKNHTSLNSLPSNFTNEVLETGTYVAGFDASWEIDIFGGQRRALEAANAQLAAIVENQRDAFVTLLGEVASTYVQVRGFQRRLDIARKNLDAQQEALDITRLRFRAGLASELDVSQASSLYATTSSQVPAIEAALRQAIYQLSVLLGQQPAALVAELTKQAPIPATPPEVPIGLPADLLLRRPDVRSSERLLAAANAQIGVAEAELFPKFFLTGTGGYESLHPSDFISPASKFWSVGPSVTWRLLEYPRLRAEVQAQTAQQEQALAQYYKTVLTAVQDVENSLIAYGKEKERYQSLAEAAKASGHAKDLANDLYTKGLGEFLNVLDAERSLYLLEDQLVQSETTVSLNLVSLYKALGGGWEPGPLTKQAYAKDPKRP